MGAEPASRLEGRVPAGWLPMSHAESLRSVEGVDLIAFCDANADLLRQRGAYYGVQDLYTDYRELLDQVRPDIVTIATRTPVKCEIIEYACRNGVQGIYVEKPLANSLEDCRLALSRVAQSGVKLAYGVNRRYHTVYRHAKELILRGEIGEVIEVVAEHGQSQLLWSHPHTVDLILFLSSSTDVVNIQASLLSDTVNRTSNLTVDSDPVIESAFFKFATGITANIVRSGGLNVRIGGTTGNLVVHADGSFIQVSLNSAQQPAYYLEQHVIHPLPSKSATVTAMTELVQAITADAPPPISLDAIEVGTQMLMGCVWSHLHDGKLIHVSDVPSQLVVTGKYGDLYA